MTLFSVNEGKGLFSRIDSQNRAIESILKPAGLKYERYTDHNKLTVMIHSQKVILVSKHNFAILRISVALAVELNRSVREWEAACHSCASIYLLGCALTAFQFTQPSINSVGPPKAPTMCWPWLGLTFHSRSTHMKPRLELRPPHHDNESKPRPPLRWGSLVPSTREALPASVVGVDLHEIAESTIHNLLKVYFAALHASEFSSHVSNFIDIDFRHRNYYVHLIITLVCLDVGKHTPQEKPSASEFQACSKICLHAVLLHY
jgi:hypothetical protein